MIRIISASARIGGSKFLPPYLWWRPGAMWAGARESRLRASERPPGGVGGARGQLAAKTRPPGRVPGAAVRLLGARAPAPVAPDPAAKTGNSRRAGGCGPCPVDNLWQHGNMATWQHGIVASVSLRRRCPSWNGGFRLLLVFDTPGPRCAGHYNQTEPSHVGRPGGDNRRLHSLLVGGGAFRRTGGDDPDSGAEVLS